MPHMDTSIVTPYNFFLAKSGLVAEPKQGVR